ncbi:Signal transducer regulating beta-lactamase production, contains metallopeptidase domain [Oscillibacter sp. PC13]|uniref:M56 family metallopeptidase n=1 Tax=Oscillibacter sp. PC13 TaxID=1855299 RepID=UPI0008F2490D|nr:M56 family metallopeptidase [Oscillibacter sp. PC13]SFP89642.1 Signal transducer regulating beta-lactamase production, contains metallopeptidase domain [Oscillibacter sp. PC13]
MIDALFRLTLSGSAAVLAWGLVHLAGRGRLPARWEYRILKCSLLFMLIPVGRLAASVGKWLSGWIAAAPAAAIPTSAPSALLPAVPTPAIPSPAPFPEAAAASFFLPPQVFSLLTVLWAIGAAGVLAYKLYACLRFRRWVLGGSRAVTEPTVLNVLHLCRAQSGIRCRAAVRVHPLIPSPLVTGLLRPVILLPGSDLSSGDLRYLFLHELTHLKRRDLWIRTASLAGLVIHWYNPLMHLLHREILELGEQSCDEHVAALLSREERFAYGNLLLRMAAAAGPAEWAASLSTREALALRLNRVLRADVLKGRRRLPALLVTAAILACGTAAALAVRSPLLAPEADARILPASVPEAPETAADSIGAVSPEEAVWFTPEDLHDIQSAELVWWDGTAYPLLDSAAPAVLEHDLGAAQVILSTGCPFHSVLYLQRSDGVVGKLLPAEDSCAVYQSDGIFYDFSSSGSGDNALFYQLFGITVDTLPVYTASLPPEDRTDSDADTPAEPAPAPAEAAPAPPEPEERGSGDQLPAETVTVVRGDAALILSRGGKLLADDAPSGSFCWWAEDPSVKYKLFEDKNGFHREEYLVGNREALIADETRRGRKNAEETVDGWLSDLPGGEYPKNSRGETYGSTLLADYVGYEPDLVAARGTQGESGYICRADEAGIPHNLPKEICPHEFTVPLYDAEHNVIGEFPMGCGGHFSGGMTMEEAKAALAAGEDL